MNKHVEILYKKLGKFENINNFTAKSLDGLSSRIIGGENASIEDFPYQVALEYIGKQHCGGSIVAENWIVTTAICVHGIYENNLGKLKVRAGTDERESGGSLHQVDQVIRHEKFSFTPAGLPVNDIALVHVIEPFGDDETHKPIAMFKTGENSVPGKMGNVTGFGLIEGFKLPKYLQSVEVPVMDLEKCNEALKEKYGKVPDGTMCVGYDGSNEKNACVGDYGSPLRIDGRLAGIVSITFYCNANPYFPPLYTEVSYYRDWIDQHLKQHVN